MRGFHDISGGVGMTFQAGACHILPGLELAFDDVGMIHVHGLLWQEVSGARRDFIGAREEVKDRDEDHEDDPEQAQGPEGESFLHTLSLPSSVTRFARWV